MSCLRPAVRGLGEAAWALWLRACSLCGRSSISASRGCGTWLGLEWDVRVKTRRRNLSLCLCLCLSLCLSLSLSLGLSLSLSLGPSLCLSLKPQA